MTAAGDASVLQPGEIEAGEQCVLVTHRLALAADAHLLLEKGDLTGKIILTMD